MLLPPLEQLQVYCINLDRRPDRWAHAQSEWAKLGCAAEHLHRVAAVDTRSYVGCAQSHQQCVRLAREQGLPYVAVLEDDVEFREAARAVYEQIRARLPDDCGVFYGGVSFADKASAEFAPGLRRLGECTGLFCVVYFAAAYEAVLAWQPSDGNIDRYLGRLAGLERVLCVPFLAGTTSGHSDLRKRETKDALVIARVEQQFLQARPDAPLANVFSAESRMPRVTMSRAMYERGAVRAPLSALGRAPQVGERLQIRQTGAAQAQPRATPASVERNTQP